MTIAKLIAPVKIPKEGDQDFLISEANMIITFEVKFNSQKTNI